jgi:hypothetical protein
MAMGEMALPVLVQMDKSSTQPIYTTGLRLQENFLSSPPAI